jgi:ribosomal protein S13
MAKDLLEKLGDYRQKRVMDLSDQQVIRLQKSLQELENLVIKEASKIDPTRGSLKLRTTVALANAS